LTPDSTVVIIIIGLFVALDLVLLRHVLKQEKETAQKDKVIIFHDISFLNDYPQLNKIIDKYHKEIGVEKIKMNDNFTIVKEKI